MYNKKKGANRVAVDSKQIRLRTLVIFCFVLLVPTLYLFYCVSGLYLLEVDISHMKEQIMWCILHPVFCYNDKTAGVMAVGFLIWMIASFSAYSRMNYNFMHGNEFGSVKWGSIREFNAKYASATEKETGLSTKNKVLSENVRFRYDSDTLRNNNVLVVGGSGAGKTAFFLTPNLLSLHDCNIYTDPKGSLVEELGGWLGRQADTRVYVLNMCDMEKSLLLILFFISTRKAILPDL